MFIFFSSNLYTFIIFIRRIYIFFFQTLFSVASSQPINFRIILKYVVHAISILLRIFFPSLTGFGVVQNKYNVQWLIFCGTSMVIFCIINNLIVHIYQCQKKPVYASNEWILVEMLNPKDSVFLSFVLSRRTHNFIFKRVNFLTNVFFTQNM